MVYDITREFRDFTYVTSVYKCIAAYNLKGHQIGRKVGDMLEILTMGGIYKNQDLLSRLDTEGKLKGFTTAGHKVEFCFYQDRRRKKGLFGAVECKCVGVEETAAGKGSKKLRKKALGESFDVSFSGRWMSAPIVQRVKVISGTNDRVTIELSNNRTNAVHTVDLAVEDSIRLIVDENQTPLHTTPHGNMLTEIPGLIRICKTVKFDGAKNGIFQFSLYNCLAGPQTIEKAKQASLVAMDLRKKVDGHWGREEVPEAQRRMNFVHVICEHSHWEKKSRNVINACIDHNLIVADAVLIKALKVFEAAFGTEDMFNQISKNRYAADYRVRDAIQSVFEYFEDHVFYDAALNSYVQFGYEAGKLVISKI